MSIQIDNWVYPDGIPCLYGGKDWPPEDKQPFASLYAENLVKLLSRVVRCALPEKDEPRHGYAVTGVLLSASRDSGRLTATATDGRFVVSQSSCGRVVRDYGSFFPSTAISSAAAKLVLRAARNLRDSAVVRIHEDVFGVWFEGFLSARLAVDNLPGRFPDPKSLLDGNAPAAGAIGLFTAGTLLPLVGCDILRIELDGADVRLTAESLRGDGPKAVVATWRGDNPATAASPVKVVLDSRRLRRMLAPIPPRTPIDLRIHEPGGFVEITTDDGYVGRLMPMLVAEEGA